MYDHRMVVSAELEEGESLKWSAQPRQGLMLRRSDYMMIPFSIFWLGFAIHWEYSAIAGDAPLFMLAIGALFIFLGLQFAIGRFFRDTALREKTFYGITDRRVIILSGIKEKLAIYLPLNEITSITCPDQRLEPGLLLLSTSDEPPAMGMNGLPTPRKGETIYCFDNLEDVETPRRLLEALKQPPSFQHPWDQQI